jgi:cellulose synthase/poly-beta-1,6-N-acetylglucosamine synthase-like glycosyltransferase
LCPLYKEAKVLPKFIDSISNLDWPKDRLEVLLLLEEHDRETINACENLKLPFFVKTVLVPHSYPKTKPKACNYGLGLATGEYVVIYDAEDSPDFYQLKKAYLGFRKVPGNVKCLQAKLNYYNSEQNLLTRLFTAEYSLWFDLILPGLQSIGTYIPLGGTSNHFRRKDLLQLEGWDPFNVTEDCDLGARIYNGGFRTAIIDSTTLEEANSNLVNWLRQRSRWIKGYMQTYLVHMRNPLQFARKYGKGFFFFQLVIGCRVVFLLINPILWLLTIGYFALHSLVGAGIEALYPAPIFYIAVGSLVAGNFLYLYYYMIGCARRGQYLLIKYIYTVPIYWIMGSFSALIAMYQLIVKPHYWEKTNHGLDRISV